MQIDLDEKETKILVAALRKYYYDMKEDNELLIHAETTRKASKPQGFCCISPDDDHVAKIKTTCEQDEKFCETLKDKLKKHQMIFPMEEHKLFREWASGLSAYDKRCFGD